SKWPGWLSSSRSISASRAFISSEVSAHCSLSSASAASKSRAAQRFMSICVRASLQSAGSSTAPACASISKAENTLTPTPFSSSPRKRGPSCVCRNGPRSPLVYRLRGNDEGRGKVPSFSRLHRAGPHRLLALERRQPQFREQRPVGVIPRIRRGQQLVAGEDRVRPREEAQRLRRLAHAL